MQKNRLLLFVLILFTALAQSRAQSISCNSLVQFSLDENCTAIAYPDDLVSGQPCQCPQLVEIDKTLPFGDGPWEAPNLDKNDVNQTYLARVTDIGTGDQCSSSIQIVDKVPPVLVCTGLTTVSLGANGNITVPVSALQVTAADACADDPGDVTVHIGNNQSSVYYNCDDRGLNLLTLTATDAHGNSASCQTTVLVENPNNACAQGCIASCPPSQTVTFEQGVFSLLPAWEANDLTPFDAFDPGPVIDDFCIDPTTDTTYEVNYQPMTAGQSAFVREWKIYVDGGFLFGHCKQYVIFPTSRTISFSGKVFLDSIQNCVLNGGEDGVDAFDIVATKLPGNEKVSVTPGPNGNYTLDVSMNVGDTALIVKIQLPGGFVTVCPSVLFVPANTSQTQNTLNFGLYSEGQCALPQVSVGNLWLRRCFDDNSFVVRYANMGYVTLPGAYVTLELDSLLSLESAPLPYTSNGTVHTFQLGDLEPFTSHTFTVRVGVSCDAVLEQTLCMEAVIYPHDPCGGQLWNGPIVEARARCEGDSARLVIRNVGNADMFQDGTFIVVEDIIMRQSGPFNLVEGDSMVIKVPANGSTWRIEAEQVPGYLTYDEPSASLEACGGINNPGLVNAFSMNDAGLYRDIDCNQVVSSFDPNDKTAVPTGYNAEHIIRANTDLEYKIRFQNTGTDTAFTVVIVDTLSALLDPATFEAGVSSHPYRLDVYESGILNFVFPNILLPDSNVNEAASHGFLTFRIAQKPDLPDGTVIENKAAIYFDFNEAVITNTAFHTIGSPYIILSAGQPSLPDVAVTVRPNPFRDRAVLEVSGHEMREGLLRLYDAQGRTVQEQVFEGNQCKIEGGRLPAGAYFFRITDRGAAVSSGSVQVW